MKYVAGVDVGSTQTKAVILDENKAIVGRALLDMETSMVTVAQDAFRAALDNAGIAEDDVAWVAGTGYGRYKVTFGREQVTEISCHARGSVMLFPLTRTVIDIGGQDTKAIRVGPDGWVYITDIEHQSIDWVDPAVGGKPKNLLQDSRIRWADGLSFGGDGYCYLADSAIPDQMLRSKGHIRKSAPYFIFRWRY